MHPATFGLKAVQLNTIRNLIRPGSVSFYHTSSILRLLLLVGFHLYSLPHRLIRSFISPVFPRQSAADVLFRTGSASTLGLVHSILELWIAIGLVVPLWRKYAAALASGLCRLCLQLR